MNYQQAVQYLNSFINFERLSDARFNTTQADLERFKQLLGTLGDPHRKYRIVHVVGTKGKGSTCALIASILRTAGYRIGVYTSPHLVSVRERIRVDGRMIPMREFAGVIDQIKRTVSQYAESSEVSYRTVFEYLTAAAFLYFARRDVDVAVVEAGLGARFDATIVVDPDVTVITSIGLDHTSILGNTLTEIARDKAYAIKPGKTAITAPQSRDVLLELYARSESVGASLSESSGRIEFDVRSANLRETVFQWKRVGFAHKTFRLRLAGLFQLDNLSTALLAVERLTETELDIPPEAIELGISNAQIRGRMQYIPGTPSLVLDGSHNSLSIEALTQALKQCALDRRWRVVFSALKSKPTAEMMKILSIITEKFYLASVNFPKGIDAATLGKTAESIGVNYCLYKDIGDALKAAIEDTKSSEGVLATGSFYLVGEVLRIKRGLPPPPSDGLIDWTI